MCSPSQRWWQGVQCVNARGDAGMQQHTLNLILNHILNPILSHILR